MKYLLYSIILFTLFYSCKNASPAGSIKIEENKNDFIKSKNNEIFEIVLIMENIINKELQIKLDIKKFIMGER